MGTPELDDDVVAAACSGEPDALRQVYETLAPTVLGYLRSRGVSDPEATTSEVFLAVLPKLARLHGGAAGLRTLVFSVAHARMVDDRRSRARRPRTVEFEPGVDQRPVPSAEDDALQRIAGQSVQDVLAQLPPDQAEVIRLRIIADLSIEQVAIAMGRSAGAIKQLQRRGLIALRAVLKDRQVTR